MLSDTSGSILRPVPHDVILAVANLRGACSFSPPHEPPFVSSSTLLLILHALLNPLPLAHSHVLAQ
eukprot:7172361-Pyramimonas_sp.AAC.1